MRDSLELAVGECRQGRCREPRRGPGGDAALLAKASKRPASTEIDPLGEPFDPELHEAMMAQASADRRAEHGAAGDPAGLRAQWPAAAPGAGDRVQGADDPALKAAPATLKAAQHGPHIRKDTFAE